MGSGFILTLILFLWVVYIIFQCYFCCKRCDESLDDDPAVTNSSPIVVTSTESRPISNQTQITRQPFLSQNTHQPMPMPLPQYGFQVDSSTCPYPTSGQQQFPPYPVDHHQQPSAPYLAQQNSSNSTRNNDQSTNDRPDIFTWLSFEARSLRNSQARNPTSLSDSQSRSQQPSAPNPTIEQPSAPHQTSISVEDDDLPPSFDEVMSNPKYFMPKK